MQKSSKFILKIFFLLVIVSNYAQNKQIRNYNLEDGLPQSQVYDIVQDDLGYLWLGTQGGGIARFDGDEFTVWNEKNGLLSNYINAITFLNDELYIGTNKGLSIKFKYQFKNYNTPKINKIRVINNQLYLATKKGVYAFNKSKGLQKIAINKLIDNNLINDIKFKNDWFFVATNVGLFKINKDFSKKIKLSAFNFTSIACYKDKIFCASFSNGILVFDNTLITNAIINTTKRINSISVLNKNQLFIATDNAGVLVINTDNYKQVKRINRQNGLSILHIRKSIKDKQGNLWLASSGGFFKIYENNFTHYKNEEHLKIRSVYAIESLDNDIYFSNAENGIVKLDSLGFTTITQGKDYLKNTKIKTLAKDKFDNLFAGTDGKGVLIMHNAKKDSIFSYLKSDNTIAQDTLKIDYKFIDSLNVSNGLLSDWIRKIHIENNNIWVASYASGISKFNYNSDERTIDNRINFGIKQGIKDLEIKTLSTDLKGTLWYGTKYGDLGYIKNNKVKHFKKILGKATEIRTLLFNKNNLFIGTSDRGIWHSNLIKPIKFAQLKGKKELYSNNIYQLIFDANQQLWAGSENGVDKIILDKKNTILDVQHFGRNEGFLGIETCLNAIAKDTKENIWFGTINGLTKHQPSITKIKKTKPSIFFEDIQVMNNSLDTIFSKIDYKLKPSQNLLSFYYKTIDLNNPNELQYRWKIDDLSWSNWNKDTKVNIASDYGLHTFFAQSRNLSWQKSKILSFSFFREKPLLQKTWFRTLLITFLGLLILGLFFNYFNTIKKKNLQEKERLQLKNKLLGLEQKALRLQMNPHFIFNVLNGIKAMSTTDIKAMHKTINKFATLLRGTLINSRKNAITLKQEIETLKNYIEVEQLMSEKEFSYTINTTTDLDTEEILIPPMLIQPFVENAIRHGIMAVKRKGKLIINFTTKNDFLHCKIVDNGIGINQSKQNKINSSHQSMALEVTKERIEHLVGSNTLEITEITDKNNKLAGTKITFKIPLETDY